MRLWSLHPSHLDSKGLVALWREGLLARAVLSGKTKGYKNHPQLERFKSLKDPIKAIDSYLSGVVDEAVKRGYNFDKSKIEYHEGFQEVISVTVGQVQYEWTHLLAKLAVRDCMRWDKEKTNQAKTHSIFSVIEGTVEQWEKV